MKKSKIIKEDFSLVAFLLIFILSFVIMYIYLENKKIYTITKKTIEQSVEIRLENLQEQINLYAKKEDINKDKIKIALSIIKTDSLRREVESMFRDIDIEQNTNKSIAEIPSTIIATKEKLEVFLQQVNVTVHNVSEETAGSGVTIKYNGNFYILSAGHMAEKETDQLELWENNVKVCDLEIVKHDYTLNDASEEEGAFLKTNDLILLRPTNRDIIPTVYTELANKEPRVGTEIYVVGNPLGRVGTITNGRIIMYRFNFIEYVNHTYFGNSGGGIYNKEGKLLGIVSHLEPYQPFPNIPAYMIYRAVRLEVIMKFLKGV